MGLRKPIMGESINELLADKNSPAYMHQCEVASVVRMYHEKGGDFVKSFLLKVEKHRGTNAATRLREEALQQVQMGKANGRKR